MKGIVLAGGLGTRLHPLTISVSKQLLPLFDKPMIYYPISTLMRMGIKEILCICKKEDLKIFKKILKNGKQWGIDISFEVQLKPSGIAESLIIGKNFVKKDSVALILGDNIFYGIDYNIKNFVNGATIFAYKVQDPQRYGVIELKNSLPYKIIEKPKKPKSNLAVTGLYLYDNSVLRIVKNIKPSKRNELEITDVNNEYLKHKKLKVNILKQGNMWLDAGSFNSLLQASHFIQTIQERQNIQIGSPEGSALEKKFITITKLKKYLETSPNNEYYNYLRRLL